MRRHGFFRRARDGQSLIESCVIICLIGVLFAGLLQISQLFAAREILHHAAARGARAKTVGFNWWMVEKSIRVASIPNAGRLIEPAFENEDFVLRFMTDTRRPGDLWEHVMRTVPSSLQLQVERTRIPHYLATDNRARGSYILDYEEWDSVQGNHETTPPDPDDDLPVSPILQVTAQQDYPLRIPLHRTFYAEDSIRLEANSYLENHYSLYLDDQYW
jgi:hypothetical protein